MQFSLFLSFISDKPDKLAFYFIGNTILLFYLDINVMVVGFRYSTDMILIQI